MDLIASLSIVEGLAIERDRVELPVVLALIEYSSGDSVRGVSLYAGLAARVVIGEYGGGNYSVL